MLHSKMLKTVEQELTHIPRGPKGGTQNVLRSAYQNDRMHNLGKQADFPNSRSLTMKQSLEFSKKCRPNEKFDYDKEYFGDWG